MDGDEEEDGVDDLENEFNFDGRHRQEMDRQGYGAEAMLHGHMSYGRASDSDLSQVHPLPQVPLLTNGQMVLTTVRSFFTCFTASLFSLAL